MQQGFGWLLSDAGAPASPGETAERRTLLQALWTFEAWRLVGSSDDDKECSTADQFGYALLDALARLIASGAVTSAPEIWRPIFALGPRGHYALSTFLRSWFSQISETINLQDFAARWRPMIEFILGADWIKKRFWYHGLSLQRQILGFGETSSLARNPGHDALILGVRDLYELWATSHLHDQEDDLAGFCSFLSTEVGTPLRLEGIQWIAAALETEPGSEKWYRDYTGNALMEFLNTLISENREQIVGSPEARDALLAVIAHAVSRQIPAALPLQDRVRRLLHQ